MRSLNGSKVAEVGSRTITVTVEDEGLDDARLERLCDVVDEVFDDLDFVGIILQRLHDRGIRKELIQGAGEIKVSATD